jgi:hypothetical protein
MDMDEMGSGNARNKPVKNAAPSRVNLFPV